MVSELVTNAVLHARTPIVVRVAKTGSGARVEVEDGHPYVPPVDAVRAGNLQSNRSMTGRGLALVAATADRWGSEATAAGKVCWAEIGTGRPRPPAPVAGQSGGSNPRGRPGRLVCILGAPVDVVLESTRQLSDLQREVQMMALGGHAPAELTEVVRQARTWVPDIDQWTDSDRLLAEQAAASGRATVDFDVFVPADVGRRIEGIAGWLARAASSIDRRLLLSVAPTREVVAYRRWYADEILRQLAGQSPRRCPIQTGAGRAGR